MTERIWAGTDAGLGDSSERGALTAEQLRRIMLGLSDEAENALFELELASQPALALSASTVEADAFLKKLRQNHIPDTPRTAKMSEKMAPMPPGTELESNEDIQRALAELRQQPAPNGKPQGASVTHQRDELPYRPTSRPPVAILIVCDDGETSGEVIRLRTDRFIIGRTEGDLQLPDDEQVSSRHVALTRQVISGQTRWVVTDLQSRNGLFVRVSKAPLVHLTEFLIGGGRYRLELMQQAVAETAAYGGLNAPAAPTTRAFADQFPLGSEMLSELLASGTGARVALNGDHLWIGSDPDCEICRRHDPFVSGKHACLTRSPKGTWLIQGNRTLNGIWLRVPQVVLDQGKKCEFQIGEQRFRLRYGVPL